MIAAKATLYRPVMMWLRIDSQSGYQHRVALGSRLDWESMAGSLDWSIVDNTNEFQVQACYAAYQETRKKSKHAAYDGRRDYRRIPHGRQYDHTICEVRRGRGKHCVQFRYKNGSTSEWLVPQDEVIKTVRLFVSAQYYRHGLDMRAGANVTEDSVHMLVNPVER